VRRIASQVVLLVFLVALPAPLWQQQKRPSAPTPSSPPAQPTEPSTSGADGVTTPPASAEEDLDVGAFYLHKGDPDAAIPRFQEAIRLKPDDPKARLLLGEAYEKKGAKPEAVRCFREYLHLFPKAPDAKKIRQKLEKLTQ
jgi:tetratricopeptide (TPR) repeat protein